MNTITLSGKVASIDVDPQRTFTPLCPNELPVPGGDEIADELNAQAAFANVRIGTSDAHPPRPVWLTEDPAENGAPLRRHPNADRKWVAHAVVGTPGFDLIPGLPSHAEYDLFIFKGVVGDMHPFGACYHDLAEAVSTGLIEALVAHDVAEVIVGGLALDYCVKDTVLQLRRAGFGVIVNLAATRGIAPDTTAAAIKVMRKAGARFVDSARDIVRPRARTE